MYYSNDIYSICNKKVIKIGNCEKIDQISGDRISYVRIRYVNKT